MSMISVILSFNILIKVCSFLFAASDAWDRKHEGQGLAAI